MNTLKRRERGGRRPRSRPALIPVEPFHLEAFEKEPDYLVAAVGVFVLVTVGGVDPQGLDTVIRFRTKYWKTKTLMKSFLIPSQ